MTDIKKPLTRTQVRLLAWAYGNVDQVLEKLEKDPDQAERVKLLQTAAGALSMVVLGNRYGGAGRRNSKAPRAKRK